MIAVLFEVQLAPGRTGDYLAEAAALRDALEAVDGFVSVERYQSLADPDRLLSLSFWRDDEAVARWRTLERHREAQARGRAGVFAAYRLRIANVIRDYGMHEPREQAPADSRRYHDEAGTPPTESSERASSSRPPARG
jgi:heme-degrading monooxygenase HmoA